MKLGAEQTRKAVLCAGPLHLPTPPAKWLLKEHQSMQMREHPYIPERSLP